MRRMSASQRCSGWSSPSSPLRSVASIARRRSAGPAIRYIKASRVPWSAHCRSSTTKATGRIRESSVNQSSIAKMTSFPVQPPGPEPGFGTPSRAGARRKAERRGNNGAVIEFSGKAAPARIHISEETDAQACCTNAVLPTPGSPETTRVQPVPDIVASKETAMSSSSVARPTSSEPITPSSSATKQVSHRCTPREPQSQGFARTFEGSFPMPPQEAHGQD